MFNVLLCIMLLYLVTASASFDRQQELSNMSFMTESSDSSLPPPKRPRVDLTLDHRPQIIPVQLIKPADSAINKTTPNCMENNVHPNNLDIPMRELEPRSVNNFGAIDCVSNVSSKMNVDCNAIRQKTDFETESLTHANLFYTTQCVPATHNPIALLEQNSHKALIHDENPIDTTQEQTFLHKTSVTDQNSETLCNASDENDNAENLLKIIADIPYLELVGLIEKVCESAREEDSGMNGTNNDLLFNTYTNEQHCQEPDFGSSKLGTILGKVKEGIKFLSFELFNEQIQRIGNVASKDTKSKRKNMCLELDEYKNLVHTSTNVLNLEYSDFLHICKLPECSGLLEKLSKMMETSATNRDFDFDTTNCNLDDKMKNKKCFESCNELEKLIAELNYDSLGQKSLKTLYLAFITHMCLDSNTKLGCYVLEERLWKIHVYMPEFYFYILWKLKRLDINYRKIDNDICSYKEHLIDEMQYISKIINLSDSIEISEIDLVTYQKLIENVYKTVDKFRYHILKYLVEFHTRESSTTLYFLAYKMRDMMHNIVDPSSTVSSNFREWDGDCLYAAAVSRIKENRLKETRSKERELDFVCFRKLHRAKMTKNTIFICAFTVMISNQKLFVWNDATFIEANKNVKSIVSMSRFFHEHFYCKAKYGKAIDAALLNVLVYVTFLKNLTEPDANAQTSSFAPKPFNVETIHEQILKMSGLSSCKKLILYRDLILDAMMA